MTPDQWLQVREVFHAVVELPTEQRSTYLDRVCAAEPSLREEVESLLQNHADAGDLLETPARVEPQLTTEDHDPWLGKNIGPYQTIARIGQGGMGSVYRAVRIDDHYLKQVAIKLVRTGLGTGHYLRRFKNERQIMASLDHPNIARLLDGGATGDGLPYLVMEYIEGEEIDKYCDSHRLDTLARLKIFRQVCSAVQYAHQNLVVHRDLKPGNILVMADGTPKLLDFGIAKLLDPELFFQTLDPVGTVLRAMTPEYASPEQVRGELVTTATDVYSLGVILYRLLTGHHPYWVDGRDPLLLARQISDTEPEKPSLVIDRVEEVASSGETRLVTPERLCELRNERHAILRRRLSGDLDNIVLKALRKEPTRRYVSVEQFSEDIQRYLDGMPVLARSDTFGYRAGKFITRHKAGVAGTALVFVSLLTGLFFTIREARIAEAQRARAERRFNDVRKLARDLMLDVHDSIQYLPGATPARKLIIQDALEYLDSLAKEASGDLSLQRELAVAYEKVGDVQGWDVRSNLGDTAGALQSFRKSLAIRQALAHARPQDPQARSDLAEGYMKVGDVLLQMGDRIEALKNIDQALEIRKQLSAAAPQDKEAQLNLAIAYDGIANALAEDNNLELSLANTRQSLAIFESLLAGDPGNSRYRRDVSLEHKKIGGIYEATGKLALALEEYQKALPVDEALAAENVNDALARRDLAIDYANVGDVLLETGDTRGALRRYEEAVEIDEKLAQADPKDAWAQRYLAYNYNRMGDALLKSDRRRALSFHRKALELAEARSKADASNASAREDLAKSYSKLAGAYFFLSTQPDNSIGQKKNNLREARSWYQKSLEVWQSMRDRGILSGLHSQEPERVALEISRCQAALDQLSASAGQAAAILTQ
jgi:serine/threonine protein kinase/tetratricopeptide (TPR) repeat protein